MRVISHLLLPFLLYEHPSQPSPTLFWALPPHGCLLTLFGLWLVLHFSLCSGSDAHPRTLSFHELSSPPCQAAYMSCYPFTAWALTPYYVTPQFPFYILSPLHSQHRCWLCSVLPKQFKTGLFRKGRERKEKSKMECGEEGKATPCFLK